MKYTITILAFLLALLATAGHATAQPGHGRLVIIKHSDTLSDTAVYRINSHNDADDDDQSCDTPCIPKVISSLDFNLGFTNINGPANIPAGSQAAMPELQNGKSLGIGIGQNWGFNLAAGKLRFWTGVRYDIHNYRFRDPNVRLNPGDKEFNYKVDSGSNSEKSKVVVNYIGVPLALGYQSNPQDEDDGFWIRGGVTAGYLMRVHSKIKTSSGKKEKEFDDFNFNNMALTPFIYIGYNDVAIYAKVTTTPLFKKNQGPECNAFEFGLLLDL